MNQNGKMFLYFSQLVNIDVVDKEEKHIGSLYDVIVGQSEIAVYPKATHLIIAKGLFNRRYAVVPWGLVKERTKHSIEINLSSKEVKFDIPVNNREKLVLKRDILDQQVVDISNHNVIRVNDIHLLIVERDLMLAHVDIGARGFIRRLGFEKIVDTIVRLFNEKAIYLNKEKLISWKHIQPLSINPVSKTIKVDVSQRQLNDIHPADLSEIMLNLDHKHRLALFRTLDLDTKSEIFSLLDFPEQKSLLDDLSYKETLEIISNMPSDKAVDLLDELPKESVNKMLSVMETPKAKKLSTLLGYKSESAGGLMTTEFFALPQQMTVGEALAMIKMDDSKPESMQYLYIVDEKGQLLGATNLRRLISLDPKENILKAKFRNNIFIYPTDSVKEIAVLMEKYKINVIPVVNEEKILQGIITVDDILDHLISIAWRRWRKKNPAI
ncbi:MAG: CBS domain-containing protein [Candidatus Omnitrophica bacterium]|nr:CBS domain-containing protein [Candidatus Omnitrophota bacterium]MDD5352558.1 CBS domain-containing protein [Candidatus Omnitrophota bacterium]MDD5550156.1 CBS domain-containing protein [Candidatus Omnitrophota bacterium]